MADLLQHCHGCNSILATKMALSYGDYVITEAGFGADLEQKSSLILNVEKLGYLLN